MCAKWRSKYGAKKTVVDGLIFDSKREAKRWLELKQMEKAGEISGLRRQVPYELIPEHREPDLIGPRGGRTKGKLIESSCKYVADFVYVDKDGVQVVEDSKGFRTADYKIKRKLMYDRYGIRIKET